MNYNFKGIRPEFRFDAISSYAPFYVGIEVPVTEMRRQVSGRFTRTDGSRLVVSNALQERTRVSLIAKVGIQHAVWNRLFLDAYIGFGAAYRHLEYSNFAIERVPEDEVFEEWGLFSSGLSREGGLVVPEVAAGLRLGYWLSASKK